MARKYSKSKKTWRKKRLTGYQSFSQRAPVATKMLTRMKYHDNITINPAINQCATHVFSCNGLYDPDVSGVGHQPRGFDQLMTLYDHFVGLGAKIKVHVGNSENTAAMVIGVAVLDTSTSSTSVDYYMESGYVKHALISGGNQGARTLTLNVNPNRFLGRTKPLSDPELKGSTSANPSEGAFFHVFAYSPDAAIEPGNVNISVNIEYACALIEPKIPNAS